MKTVKFKINASVTSSVEIDDNETIEQFKGRLIDIYLHNQPTKSGMCCDKHDLGADRYDIEVIPDEVEENPMRYLYIEFEVQDGERRHTHRSQHTTRAKNINFAGERFVATFWGHGERENNDEWWWIGGEFAMRLVKVIEMTEHEHRMMNKFFI
jgi:hypothetical protein